MHVIAAQVGGIRYEAYLFALAVLAGIVSAAEGDSLLHALEAGWKKFPLRRYVQLPGLRHATLAALLLPMLVRSGFFLYHYPISVQNIYQQQIQMARFVGRYYPESAIAANDIGAITFFTDIRLTDLFCIGDQEVFAAARRHQLTASFVDDLTTRRGTTLAIVYDRAVGHLLPPKWTRVATWTIPDNFICADETVSFYAIRPEGVAGLRQQLRDFSVSLPAAVKTSYDMR